MFADDKGARLASMAYWGIPADPGSFTDADVERALELLDDDLFWRREAKRMAGRAAPVPLENVRAYLQTFRSGDWSVLFGSPA